MRVAKEPRARCLRWIVVLWIASLPAAHAVTQDITAQFAITRSGLVFNRTTNTFDSSVTLKNLSTAPVLAPISAVVGGLPTTVTLANKSGDLPDGRPYVAPMQPGSMLASGATLAFVLKFANPQRVPFTSTLQILYSIEIPPDAPTLISVVATGGTDAGIIGRVDGLPSRSITLQAQAARTCVFGTLIGGSSVGGAITATTDAGGYFAARISGVNPGDFVAIRLSAPGTSPLSLCQVSARDNDSWPKAFSLPGDAPTASDLIDAPGKARWYRFAVVPGQRIRSRCPACPPTTTSRSSRTSAQAFASSSIRRRRTAHDLREARSRVCARGVQPERVLAVGVQSRRVTRRRCSARRCSAPACSRRRSSARACSARACSARACSRRRCSARRCSARGCSRRRCSPVGVQPDGDRAGVLERADAQHHRRRRDAGHRPTSPRS